MDSVTLVAAKGAIALHVIFDLCKSNAVTLVKAISPAFAEA